jgi:two-component system LytT family sensor kinase
VGAFTVLGLLFALQDWVSLRSWNSHILITFQLLVSAWCVHYFLLGCICWLLWRKFGQYVQRANLLSMIAIVLPLSLAVAVVEEMMWVAIFPQLPLGMPRMTFWHRLIFQLDGELVNSLVLFWAVFFLLRGLGYYQLYRETEYAAVQLETQFANAQLRALRMQLNPHFLFNTMNSISSLMRIDIEAADSLLEQLSSLLRMTLERRDVQLIPLHDEIEFTETYLAMQDCRYAGRVTRRLTVDPELHDALVPAMILQPIIENAYVHGLSKLDRGGQLSIEVLKDGDWVKALVTNSGLGLGAEPDEQLNGHRVGLANVKNRLRLHYGDGCAFSIREIDRARVQVAISIPLQLSANAVESLTRYGV